MFSIFMFFPHLLLKWLSIEILFMNRHHSTDKLISIDANANIKK